MNRLIVLTGLLLAAVLAHAQTVTLESIRSDYPYLQGLYLDLHRNPEISFQEETSEVSNPAS